MNMLRGLPGAGLVLLAAVTGCSSPTGITASPAPSSASIEGTWILENVVGRTLVDGSTIQVRISGDQITAFPGCNELRATITDLTDRLLIDEATMTEKGCEPRTLMDQDEWFRSLITAGAAVSVSESTLTLTGDTVRTTFRRR